jgi:ubiquitin-protein ligase
MTLTVRAVYEHITLKQVCKYKVQHPCVNQSIKIQIKILYSDKMTASKEATLILVTLIRILKKLNYDKIIEL